MLPLATIRWTEVPRIIRRRRISSATPQPLFCSSHRLPVRECRHRLVVGCAGTRERELRVELRRARVGAPEEQLHHVERHAVLDAGRARNRPHDLLDAARREGRRAVRLEERAPRPPGEVEP